MIASVSRHSLSQRQPADDLTTPCTLFELTSALLDLGLSTEEATQVTQDLLETGRVQLLRGRSKIRRPC